MRVSNSKTEEVQISLDTIGNPIMVDRAFTGDNVSPGGITEDLYPDVTYDQKCTVFYVSILVWFLRRCKKLNYSLMPERARRFPDGVAV